MHLYKLLQIIVHKESDKNENKNKYEQEHVHQTLNIN